MRYLLWSALPVLAAWTVEAAAEKEQAPEAPPANPVAVKPGMEGGAWSLEPWGNSGAFEKKTVQDRQAVTFIYTGGAKEKTAFKHLTGLTAAADGKIRVHVYTPEEKPPSVSLALSATVAYLWHETKTFPLKQGWNALEVPLAKPHWKTQASGWKLEAGVEHLDDLRAVDLVVWNGQATGWLKVEGLAADPDETARKVAGLIEELTSGDPEKRAKAESELVAAGRPALEALYQVRNSDRPEVLLRAGWALRKIESAQEDLPKDPAIRTQMVKQREENFFGEAKVRADYVLKSLQGERDKVLKLVKDARDEVARGRLELQKLEHTPEEEKAAYTATLDTLEKLAQEAQQLADPLRVAKEPDPKEKKPAPETEKKPAESKTAAPAVPKP